MSTAPSKEVWRRSFGDRSLRERVSDAQRIGQRISFNEDYLFRRKDSEALDLPVRVLKRRGVVRNEIMASRWTIALIAVDRRRSSPITAKSDVHDNAGISEMVADVAMSIGEVSSRFAPSRWIGSSGRSVCKIVRLGAAAEEPHADSIAPPFRGIDTTAVLVERCA